MQKLLAILGIVTIASQLNSQTIQFSISAGAHTRANTPVTVLLKKSIAANKQYEVIHSKTKRSSPVQFISPGAFVFVLADTIAANSSANYSLVVSSRKNLGIVRIEEQSNGLLVKSGEKPVLFYHTQTALPPADSPAYYQRSGFIHPVFSPNGEILTDDFPASHAHQHALFAAWTNTTFKNTFVDFWNQHLQKGTVGHVEVLSKQQGPVFARLQVLLRYRSIQFGEVLKEKWTITVFPYQDHFLFDIESEQSNTSSDTLYINQYHYGGMAFRGSKYWNPDDKKNFRNNWSLLTSEGIKDASANHTHARWVDASGMLSEKIAGITIFNHPSNFRYPQTIRVHPSMPYWVYAPMVDGGFVIAPGKNYVSRYRYFVHNDKADTAAINRIEKDYSFPPEVFVR